MGRRFSIQLALTISLVLIAAIAVLTLSAQRYFWITGEALTQELDQDLALARSVAAGLDRYMTYRRHLIETLAQEIGRLTRTGTLPAQDVLTPLIEAANHRDPAFSTLLVTDRQGVAVAFSPPADEEGRPNIGRRYGDRRWFHEAIKAVPQPSYDIVVGKALRRPTVAVAAPIRSRGDVIGVMSGGLNLDQLRASISDMHPSGSIRIAIVDGYGRVIAHRSQEWQDEARDLSSGEFFQAAKRQSEGTTTYVSEFTGDTRWAAYVRVPATGWVVWTSRGPESQVGKLRSLITGLMISGLVALAIAAVWAVVASRFLSRPILALVEATRAVSAGSFQAADALRGRDSRIKEFKALLQGFTEMADGLRTQYESLEAKVAERTTALEQTAREAQAASALLRTQEEIQRGYGELASLLNSLDRSYILNEATRKIAASLRAPLVAVYLTEDGVANLRLKTYAGLDSAPLDTTLLSPGGLPTEVIRRREPIIVSTPPDGARLALRTGVGELAIAAVAGFPMAHRDRTMGVLAVAMLEPLSEDKHGFLENAARQLSVALSNAALFESVRYQSQRMEQLNQALRRASEAKSQFLASMSHELRTPLNSIIGFTDVMLMSGRDPLTPRQRAALEKVRASGTHLLGLINQVLDLSKIEAGRMEVQAERFPLVPLVHECVAAIEPQAHAKALEVRTTGLESAPEIIQDRGKVKQILLNLLSNALKFTPSGWVEVRVAREGEGALSIAVADTGPGIAAEEREAIFEDFRQGGAGSDGSAGGTGLGLPISRRLAGLLGGTLTVESAPGRGSVFILRLPVRFTGAATSRPGGAVDDDEASEGPPGAAQILVIDDDRDVVQIIRRALADEPYRVHWAATAVEGLSRAKAARPTAILLDVILEGKEDGWEVLQALKADPATREIPVVIHSVIDNPERARQLGADQALLKPVTAAGIQAALRSLLSASTQTAEHGRDG